MVEVNKDTTTSKMEMLTQINLKEGATLSCLKTSHIYNVSDAKSIGTISQNVEQNYEMNKTSKKTSPRWSKILVLAYNIATSNVDQQDV